MTRAYYMDEQLCAEGWEKSPHFGGRTVFIYGLIDPETLECRYIGKSVRPKQRVDNHMQDKGKCHRTHWLRQLKARGLWPDIVILETVEGGWPWQESERYWIAHAKREGWPLTNNTSGGDGVPDLPTATRERVRKTWLGRKHTPQACANIAKSKRGVKASAQTRAKMSRAHKGRNITWGAKLGDANRSVTDDQARNIYRRAIAGERTGDLAKEFGLHRTTITNIKMGHLGWSRVHS